MALGSRELRRTMPALIAAIPIAIVFFAVLGIILTAAGPRELALSDARTSGWIAVVYGLPMLPTLVLSIRYRQPLVFTGKHLRDHLRCLPDDPQVGPLGR
ncbi:MAG: hypothetical protein ACRDG8_01460 [Actinomycetota bacterium]